ncbi:MAG: AAA family ATPase, partial [Archaeoglobaceae archaeon]
MTTVLLTMIILARNIELNRWDKLGNWRLVYGRRKTGKTFFVKEFTQWDHYFFVRRDGMVIDENKEILSYEAFFEVFKRELDKKRIVIDEFHRLPEEFLDYLHYLGGSGELTLISSMLWSINQLFE